MCRCQCLHASLVTRLMQCRCMIGSKSVQWLSVIMTALTANTSAPIGRDANFSTAVQLLGILRAAQLMQLAMLQEMQL